MTNEKLFFNSINNISKGEHQQNQINEYFNSAIALLENAVKKKQNKRQF